MAGHPRRLAGHAAPGAGAGAGGVWARRVERVEPRGRGHPVDRYGGGDVDVRAPTQAVPWSPCLTDLSPCRPQGRHRDGALQLAGRMWRGAPPHPPPQNVPLLGAAPSHRVPPPRWLLQFPTEDGAYGYGATLPPELFEDNAADGDGGEARAGGFVRGWGLCEGLPPPPLQSRRRAPVPSVPQELSWKPAPAPSPTPTPSWWLGAACSWASPSSSPSW